MPDTVNDALRERTSHGRFLELDGLRGLAAFTVVLGHFWVLFGLPQPMILWPFVAGHAAVVFFFVLSGFVLSLPFWNLQNISYGRFLQRRFFRIYLPFAACVLLSSLGDMAFGRRQLPLGDFFHATWQSTVTLRLVLNELALGRVHELNNALWSLRVELIVSAVFPLTIAALKLVRTKTATTLVLLTFLVAGHYNAKPTASIVFLYAEIITYLSMFALGACIARELTWLRTSWTQLSTGLRLAIFSMSASVYWGYFGGVWKLAHIPWMPNVEQLTGACGLLLCAMFEAPFRRMLTGSVPAFLGRISFSLYLMHEPVLYTVAGLGYGKLPIGVLAAIYLSGAFLISYLFCVAVEEPTLRLGKRVASRASPLSHKEGLYKHEGRASQHALR